MSETTRARRGRPRSFERAHALEQALLAFWARGFEATPISALARAMGVGVPSLYAAFGDKKSLFHEVVEVYGRTHGAFARKALDEEPTARAGVARMLREAAAEYTATDHPQGCLIISGATNCTEDSADIEQLLRDQRNANIADIEGRIRADVAAKVLPANSDPTTLARLTGVTIQGMSQQARDGATRTQLEAVATAAMKAWPDE
jgi:AcrR family transcriptional regulator